MACGNAWEGDGHEMCGARSSMGSWTSSSRRCPAALQVFSTWRAGSEQVVTMVSGREVHEMSFERA